MGILESKYLTLGTPSEQWIWQIIETASKKRSFIDSRPVDHHKSDATVIGSYGAGGGVQSSGSLYALVGDELFKYLRILLVVDVGV